MGNFTLLPFSKFFFPFCYKYERNLLVLIFPQTKGECEGIKIPDLKLEVSEKSMLYNREKLKNEIDNLLFLQPYPSNISMTESLAA